MDNEEKGPGELGWFVVFDNGDKFLCKEEGEADAYTSLSDFSCKKEQLIIISPEELDRKLRAAWDACVMSMSYKPEYRSFEEWRDKSK